MAYCFKRKESVPKGIRRLGGKRIEHALEYLKKCDRAEAIHCMRKDIKKERAVIRLVRTRVPKKDFVRLTKRLREAAACLAAPRDACIKAKTVRDLVGHFKGQLAPGALRHVRAELRKGCDEELKRFGEKKTKSAVERLLHGVAKRLARLNVNGKGWKALRPGVNTAYRQGQRAYRMALADPSPENFHAWRKRAKDLWYHVRLLHPVWPEQLEAMAGELETLGEYLGDDHDLTVLRMDIEERAFGNAQELDIINGLIVQRQRELRTAALALGVRFYAEKPSTFCDRLAGYWHAWRREKKPLTRSTAGTR